MRWWWACAEHFSFSGIFGEAHEIFNAIGAAGIGAGPVGLHGAHGAGREGRWHVWRVLSGGLTGRRCG